MSPDEGPIVMSIWEDGFRKVREGLEAEVARLRQELDEARAELTAIADSAEPYGECNPNCDCAGHEGTQVCDCHITGTAARERINDLVAQCEATEAERDRMQSVVGAAVAYRELHPPHGSMPHGARGRRYETAFLAAVDAYTESAPKKS